MITPILNINGSSADDLINPRMKAISDIQAAIEALLQATPNGRDYPGDSEQCRGDRSLHYNRIEFLSRIGHELMQEIFAIREQTK